jgi:hypothetical protein
MSLPQHKHNGIRIYTLDDELGVATMFDPFDHGATWASSCRLGDC